MKLLKGTLILSLLVNVFFIGASSFVIYKKGGINFLKNQVQAVSATQEYPDYYLQKETIFEKAESENVDKVFIGDSITDHGEFQEYFPNEIVLNRGISNDNSKGVLNRINETVNRNPKEVYIMIGVNDILYGTDIELFKENISKTIQSFDENSTKVIVQSILPVNNEIYGEAISNETIIEFNKVLQSVAKEKGIQYIDLYSNFTSDDGQLKKEFTIDGIHLNGEGYATWIGNL